MKVTATARYQHLREVPEVAKRAERLGFDLLTNGERDHHGFLPPLLALEHTERIHAATNVAIAFARTPMATAYAAWDLQSFSRGRFGLGLGSQVKAHITRRFSAEWGRPVGRLKEYIQAVRAIFDTWQKGTKLDFQGEFYKMNLMIPYFDPGPIEHPDLPIHISAVGPQMARMAGQVCDGLGWHGFHTPKHLKEVVFANFRDGAESVGRNASELEFRGGCYIVTGNTDEELEKGRRSIRKDVSFYGSTPAYHGVLSLHGLDDLGHKLHGMSREGKWEAMIDEVPDDVTELFGIVARYDDLAAEIKNRYGEFATGINLNLPPTTPEDQVADIVRHLRD